MKHKKIAFVGMMGSGKSTISKILAQKLKISHFELDEIFEKQENIKIKDFFKTHGEEKFRQIETQILKTTILNNEFVLSCGGGVILSEKNRDILFNSDIVTIYLETSAKTIFERIKSDRTRPLLLVDNPKEEIDKILSSRENFYSKSSIIINTDDKNIDEIVEEILEELWKK